MPIQGEKFYHDLGTVIDASFVTQRWQFYSDHGHLSRIGSDALTKWLGDRLFENRLIESTRSEAGAASHRTKKAVILEPAIRSRKTLTNVRDL